MAYPEIESYQVKSKQDSYPSTCSEDTGPHLANVSRVQEACCFYYWLACADQWLMLFFCLQVAEVMQNPALIITRNVEWCAFECSSRRAFKLHVLSSQKAMLVQRAV